MNFDLICKGCGAPSGPSVGVCPFCKTIMAKKSGDNPLSTSIDKLANIYRAGKLDEALTLSSDMLKARPELKLDVDFVIVYSKVMIESEAPSSKVRSILAEAFLAHPAARELSDYLELYEAQGQLKRGSNDAGETLLKAIIRRSPYNVHANFILGAHLFWIENQAAQAIPYLENCVRYHPNFVRAWGCLGALYKKIGNTPLAHRSFQKCVEIESNQKMKEFFKEQLRAS